MCCLFGLLNYSGMKNVEIDNLVNYLAQEATARGMDSTGISYNRNGKLTIYKKPKNAYEMDFKGLNECVCVSGHTRHTTQGSAKKNYNNHPFYGSCKNAKFAFSHNGVLWNDSIIRHTYALPETNIETDSYIGVQLLEDFGILNAENIGKMAEIVQGSYSFTMTDSHDNLWLVKGDSPLYIIHFPQWELYVYASTQAILFTALCRTDFVEDIASGDFEMVTIRNGDIMCIDKNGVITVDRFDFSGDNWYKYDWRNWNTSYNDTEEIDYNQKYLEDVKYYAQTVGIDPDIVDELYNEGYTIDELEDFIYSYH